jgi:hypothetical protein
MKYLKTFESLTTSVVDKIKSDIKDIFIELTDINFMIDITDNKGKLQRKNDVGRYQFDMGIINDREIKGIQFKINDYK